MGQVFETYSRTFKDIFKSSKSQTITNNHNHFNHKECEYLMKNRFTKTNELVMHITLGMPIPFSLFFLFWFESKAKKKSKKIKEKKRKE